MRANFGKIVAVGCCAALSSLCASRAIAAPASAANASNKVMANYQIGRTLYENPLHSAADVAGFRLEGEASVTFPDGRMRMENQRDAGEGQAANFVFWCPQELPGDVQITWDFTPLREPGLAILFFSARGRGGEDVFDGALKARSGEYQQYHSGDLNALHISYFRRRYESERAFHLANLRKSFGFHLVAQGADPIPDVADARGPYRIRIEKWRGQVHFWINDLPIFSWEDDGQSYGPILDGGKIGFRQMAPLVAEYADLRVSELVEAK